MHRYQVGQPYSPTRGQWPETTQYTFRGGEHELVLFWGGIGDDEVAAVSRGNVDLALYTEGDLIFLLYRIEGAVDEWSDAPYSWHLVPAEQRVAPLRGLAGPEAPKDQRVLLHIVFVDADTGLIRALRLITFDPTFTATLHAAIIDQAARPWPGLPAYEAAIADAYRRFPASTAMVAVAQVTTRRETS